MIKKVTKKAAQIEDLVPTHRNSSKGNMLSLTTAKAFSENPQKDLLIHKLIQEVKLSGDPLCNLTDCQRREGDQKKLAECDCQHPKVFQFLNEQKITTVVGAGNKKSKMLITEPLDFRHKVTRSPSNRAAMEQERLGKHKEHHVLTLGRIKSEDPDFSPLLEKARKFTSGMDKFSQRFRFKVFHYRTYKALDKEGDNIVYYLVDFEKQTRKLVSYFQHYTSTLHARKKVSFELYQLIDDIYHREWPGKENVSGLSELTHDFYTDLYNDLVRTSTLILIPHYKEVRELRDKGLKRTRHMYYFMLAKYDWEKVSEGVCLFVCVCMRDIG